VSKKHPGTSGLLPVKGSSCGIRPDPDSLTDDVGFDFSAAQQLLQEENNQVRESGQSAENKSAKKQLQRKD